MRQSPEALQDQFVDHFNKLTPQDKNEIVAALHRVAAMMDVERIVKPSLTLDSESVV